MEAQFEDLSYYLLTVQCISPPSSGFGVVSALLFTLNGTCVTEGVFVESRTDDQYLYGPHSKTAIVREGVSLIVDFLINLDVLYIGVSDC